MGSETSEWYEVVHIWDPAGKCDKSCMIKDISGNVLLEMERSYF